MAAVASARAGAGSLVVLEGAAGDGKSALLAARVALGGPLGRARAVRAGQRDRARVRLRWHPPALRGAPARGGRRRRASLLARRRRGRLLGGGARREARMRPAPGRRRASPCCTASTGWPAISPNGRRCCWRSTTCTGSIPRPCAPWRISRAASATSRSRSRSRCGRTSRARRPSCSTPSSPSRRPPGSRLRPLREASVAAIVRAALPEADDALCAACAGASAGNPFLLGELLRTVVVDAAGRDPLDAVRRAAIPDVGDRALRRVAVLGPDAVCSRAPWPSSTAAPSPTPRRSRASTKSGRRRSRSA